jgi:hypothetical protein
VTVTVPNSVASARPCPVSSRVRLIPSVPVTGAGPPGSAVSAVNMACETANGSSGGTAEYAAIEGSSFLRSGLG